MLILQDFESITPNILCRTIETVEGGNNYFIIKLLFIICNSSNKLRFNKIIYTKIIKGGLVILLLKTMNSLKQLYTLFMDIHNRYVMDNREVDFYLKLEF